MKRLVIYDSFYGNTEKVAQAIGGALGAPDDVAVVKVAAATVQQLQGVQLLIVGSPTRAFRPSPAIARFLATIPANALAGVRVAVFDTRMAIDDKTPAILRVLSGWFGYADKSMARQLLRKGGQATVPSGGFIVKASEGPLKDGELDRAAEWARGIVATL
jgi:flavodoxin I